MRRASGKPEGEVLRPLRYANTWISALDPAGDVVYVDPATVQLDPADLPHFADRDPQRVGGFWSEWTLDDEDLLFRRQRPDQQPKVLCPHCGVRQKVTGRGRLELHLGRDLPRAGLGDRRCLGSGMLARVDVPEVVDAVSRRERRRRDRDVRQVDAAGDDERPAVDLTGLDEST